MYISLYKVTIASVVLFSSIFVYPFATAYAEEVRVPVSLQEQEGLPINGDEFSASTQKVSADASLSALSLKEISFNEDFSPKTTSYTAQADQDHTQVTVEETTTHEASTVEYSTPDADAHTPGHQIHLNTQRTRISITVTAEDTITQEIYTITVTKDETPDATTDGTTVRLEVIPENLESDTQTYTAKVAVTLKTSSDTGADTSDQITKNNANIDLTISSPVDFPGVGNDVVDVFKAYPYEFGVSIDTLAERSISCTGAQVPTRAVNGDYLTVGTTRWYRMGHVTPTTSSRSYTLRVADTALVTGASFADGPHCFFAVYKPTGASGSSAPTSHSDAAEIIVDTTRPTATVVEPTAGEVYAYADEATTAKTKNNVASADCINTTSTASGWSDYTPNGATVSFSGVGRCFIFSDTAGNTRAAHTSAKTSGTAVIDYDTNNNNLIDIDGADAEALAKLNAMRYDPDGNGIPDSSADITAYRTAFPGTVPLGLIFGCPSTCTGYELRKNLDFDTDGDGKTWTGTKTNPTGDSDDAYDNSGKGWIPIDTYTATFDGNGHIIDNLFIKRGVGDDGNAGLFKTIGAAGIVRNLGLKDILVRTQNTTGGNAGGISAVNSGTIQTSFVTGTSFGHNTGLIAADNSGTIAHSYSKGSVSADGTGTAAGGVAGNNNASDGTIKSSWTATTVTKTGSGGSKNGIATDGTITNSYFDKTVYGTTTDTNGKTTTELQSPTGYTGIYSTWDDDDLDGVSGVETPWRFTINNQYPLLTYGGHQIERQAPFVASIISTPNNARATLTWTAGGDTDDVTGWQFTYKTQVATVWRNWVNVPSSTASTRSHTINSLTNGTTYLFKVRAIGGPESTETIARPAASIPSIDFDSNNNNLIEITTLEQLNAIRYDLNGDGVPSGSEIDKAAYKNAFTTSQVGFFCESCAGYELMNDLDFNTGAATRTDDTYDNSGAGWNPIGGGEHPFTAIFDGNGFVIQNLNIRRTTGPEIHVMGLFGKVGSGGLITSVALKDVSVTAGGRNVGALVGYNSGTIHASYVEGAVTGDDSVGGIVGYNEGTITASYSTASVTAGSGNAVGGLVGFQIGDSTVIRNSYAVGAITGSGSFVGGLVGESEEGAAVENSYWDTQTSGESMSPGGGTGKTTAELQGPTRYDSDAGNSGTAIYNAWDSDDLNNDGANDAPWRLGTTNGYPILVYGGQREETQRFTLDVSPGDTQMVLIWGKQYQSGITGYQYQQKVGVGSYGTWTDVPGATATTRSHIVTGLTNGTVHTFKVRPKLSVGTDSESNEVSGTPVTDNTAPTFGTITDVSTDGEVINSVRYVDSGQTVTLQTSVTDSNPPTVAPTLTLKFGSSDTERTTTAAAPTVAYRSTNVITDRIEDTINAVVTHVSGEEWRVAVGTNEDGIRAVGVHAGSYSSDICTSGFQIGYRQIITPGTTTLNMSFLTHSETVTVCVWEYLAGGGNRLSGVQTFSITPPLPLVATYSYTYTTQSGDVGPLRYRITNISDSAVTPNTAADQETFSDFDTIQATQSASGLLLDLRADSDSGTSTSDNITSDTTPSFNVIRTTTFGGPGEYPIAMYYKTEACGALPTETTTSALRAAGWTAYATHSIPTATILVEGVVSATPLTGNGVHCFLVVQSNGISITVNTYGQLPVTIDTMPPTLTTTKTKPGNTAEYRIVVTDISTPATGRTKNDVTEENCTAVTDTSDTDWSDYTPGEKVGQAHDTNGRCVVITDRAGNSVAQHLLDSATITIEFNLDLDKSGTFVPRQDLLGTYLYTAEGISSTQLREYTHNQEIGVANAMVELIGESITGVAPPLDFDGNGTVTPRQDILGAYLYTAEGISASQLREYTHNQEQGTANTMADTIDALIE